MEKIQRQIAVAQRLLFVRQLVTFVTWFLTAGLLITVLGLTIPKIWAIDALQTASSAEMWNWYWIAGGTIGGLVVAITVAWLRRSAELEAAIEIDRRFNLRERLSSALSLSKSESETGAGKALMADAVRAAERVDVRDEFNYGIGWRNLMPAVPAIVVCLLFLFVDNAVSKTPPESSENLEMQRKRIEEAEEALKDRIEEEIEKAEQLGLKDAEVALREVDRMLDENRDPANDTKEDALVRLNEAKDKIEERVKRIGDASEMRKQLSELNDSQSGPADDVSEALKDGDLEQAAEELSDLANELSNGELDQSEQEQLANQLEDIQEQLEDKARDHKENEEILRDQIREAKQEGDLQRAGELQDALDQLEGMQPQIDQMNDLANDLADASESLRDANANSDSLENAQQALQEASDQLNEMQGNLDELQSLEGLLDQISESKQMMSQEGPQSNEGQQAQSAEQGAQSESAQQQGDAGEQPGQQPGQGDQPGQQGNGANGQQPGNGTGQDGQPGQGNGEGQGTGARSETEDDTDSTRSRVDASPNEGQAVVTGTAGGENLSTQSRAEALKEVRSSLANQTDPLEDQTLPRRQQDHAREYFREFSKQK